MFGSGKRKGPVANSLGTESAPNSLSWPSADIVLDESKSDDLDSAPEDLEEPGGPGELDAPERRAALQAELDRQAEEFGLANVSPVERYGPHGEDVEAVWIVLDDIEFDEVPQDVLVRLADTWRQVDPEAGMAARNAVRRYRASKKFSDWLMAAEPAPGIWHAARSPEARERIELLGSVAEAATDAVDALILQDVLDDEDFTTLYGPWRDVMVVWQAESTVDGPEGETEGETDGETDGEEGPAPDKPDEGFGPDADLVRAFLARLGDLTQDELHDLNAAFRRQWGDDLEAAHDAVHALVDQDPILRDRVKAAQSWVESALRPMGELIARRLSDRLPVDKARALPPAVDAVTALTMRGVLDADAADVLYRPWAEVIGEPDLHE